MNDIQTFNASIRPFTFSANYLPWRWNCQTAVVSLSLEKRYPSFYSCVRAISQHTCIPCLCRPTRPSVRFCLGSGLCLRIQGCAVIPYLDSTSANSELHLMPGIDRICRQIFKKTRRAAFRPPTQSQSGTLFQFANNFPSASPGTSSDKYALYEWRNPGFLSSVLPPCIRLYLPPPVIPRTSFGLCSYVFVPILLLRPILHGRLLLFFGDG